VIFRKAIFWLHLCCGVAAGILVLIMSITGIALTYQKQMTSWADKRLFKIEAPPGAQPLSAEQLLGKIREAKPGLNGNVTLYSDPGMPASITVGRDQVTFVNPYTGEILGPGSSGMRTFFRVMTDWHRWLSLSGEKRPIGRALTGAGNFLFLLIVITGTYLWWPKKWTARIFSSLSWFRSGLAGKARDVNWHNVFGFWCIIPLIFIVASGVVISYPWASNLIFKIAGSKAPFQTGPGGRRVGPPEASSQRPIQIDGLDALMNSVKDRGGEWKTISFQPPTVDDRTASFRVDKGIGGNPQLQTTLTLDKASGKIIRYEQFKDMDSGRKARLWLRFVHTGEYYGFLGQTIAGIASAAGVILVWTGLALTFRRYISWIRRKAVA